MSGKCTRLLVELQAIVAHYTRQFFILVKLRVYPQGSSLPDIAYFLLLNSKVS